jgi:hypothetical protein
LEGVRALLPRLLDMEHFTSPGVRLAFASGPETIPWELFQGRLLPIAQTREARTFESWNAHQMLPDGPTPEPLVSLKLDAEAGRVFVVRGVEGEVWEGEGEGTIEGVRRRRWVRELIASFAVSLPLPRLENELSLALERAFTGGPLPLMPHESPHPLYSFGLLAYQWQHQGAHAPRSPENKTFDAHRLEFLVRSINDGQIDHVATALADAFTPDEFLRLVRQLFLGVSLSPWTGFVPRLFALMEQMPLTPLQLAGFHAWLLTLLGRHLTAYDLVTFHYRGANYPDALLLDESLSRLLSLFEREASLGGMRPIRRALRQAFLLRRRYEGHPVPDVPTSPGEQERVFPESHPRVPEEQLSDVRQRTRRLFTERCDFPEAVLRASVDDLTHEEEREELGAALFLDRPLGNGKASVEPDATPLLATLAFSQQIATARLHELMAAGLLSAERLDELRQQLSLPGVPLSAVGPPARQATVSLADAARVAPDIVFRRTLPSGIRRLLSLFDWGRLPTEGWQVVALSPSGHVMVHGPLIELELDLSDGYASFEGTEYPAAGLRAVAIGGQPVDVAVRPIGWEAR